MPLNYRRGGATYQVTTYDSSGASWVDAISVQQSGTTKYIPIDSNLSHADASHLRVRHNGVTYAILTQAPMWIIYLAVDVIGLVNRLL